MVDCWTALEEAGHDLTHCGMLWAGHHLYYCENCGAFILTGGEIRIFHPPKGSSSSDNECVERPWEPGEAPDVWDTLKHKIKVLQDVDHERLKQI